MTFTDYLQTQPLLRVAAVLMLGIVAGDKFIGILPLWCYLLAVLLCILLELLFKRKPYTQSVIIHLAIFFAGMALMTKSVFESQDPFPQDAPIVYEAVIVGEPQVKGKILRCDIVVTKISNKYIDKPIGVKAAILRDTVNNYWKTLHLGSGIKAQSIMQPLENFRKGNFDYVRWLQCHGIKAQTFIYYTDWQKARVSLKPLSTLSRLKLRALKFRQKLVTILKDNGNIATDDEDQQSAVVAAMVLGDKHALSSETKDEYSISGASHVLALSGLHLGIIYTILTLLLGRGYKRRWFSQPIIILAIWAYAVVVGMGTSVIRSAIMLTIYSLCLLAEHDNASLNSLSLAAIVLLVSNPLTLWDIGFQMSFMAVLTIIIFYKRIFYLLPKNGYIFKMTLLNSLIRTLWGTAAVSLAAQIGTAPLVAYYFGRFSCYFLLTNYIVVPCATIIIYGALAVFVTLPVPLICSFFVKVVAFVASFLNGSVSWLASLPGACIENIHINTVQVFCYYIIIAAVCIIHSLFKGVRMLRKMTL